MKTDMGGSAAVLGAFQAAEKSGEIYFLSFFIICTLYIVWKKIQLFLYLNLIFHLIHDIHLSPHLSFTSSSFSDTSSLSFILFSPLFCPPYILPPFLPLFHPFLPPIPSISSSSPLSLFFLSIIGLKGNFHALLCIAENSVGPLSTRPDDVHTLLSGKTVEVRYFTVLCCVVLYCVVLCRIYSQEGIRCNLLVV